MVNGFRQEGGCQCGGVRYVLHERPQVVYCCHCTECQKQSSSAFGISVRVSRAALAISGETGKFVKRSGDKRTVCEFCPDCGTRLFHNRPAYEDRLNVKGGTFDATDWLRPAGHIWLRSKQAWVLIPDDGLRYAGQPENYDALIAAYDAQWE